MALSDRPLRALIIGIDGGEPSVLFPLLDRGNGVGASFASWVRSPLESTVPPLTPTAWTTLMTGVAPGSHGLLDFVELEPSTYRLRFTNAASKRVGSIWPLLNRHGLTTGVFNVPMTYPPEEIDGFMVSGLDTPDVQSAFTHPPELKLELQKEFGEYPLDPRHLGYMTSDRVRWKVWRSLEKIEEKRLSIFQFLLDRYRPDVAMTVFTITDTVQHFFWHYWDEGHPWHVDGPFSNLVEEAYRLVLRLMERLLNHPSITEDTAVFVVSDHGFRGVSGRIFYPNRFLQRLGLLKISASGGLTARVDGPLRAVLPPALKRLAESKMGGLRRWWEAKAAGLRDMEWSGTKAFATEVVALPLGFWINDTGFGNPAVYTAEEKDDVARTIGQGLSELGLHGLDRDEVYKGPHVGLAPHILIDWWSEGLSFGKSFPAHHDAPILAEIDPLAPGPARWSGVHAKKGIFMARCRGLSPDARPGRIGLIDIAPTLFALLGLPIPSWFEGRVITEVSPGGYEVAEKVMETEMPGGGDKGYSEAEARKIEEKLRNLGYL